MPDRQRQNIPPDREIFVHRCDDLVSGRIVGMHHIEFEHKRGSHRLSPQFKAECRHEFNRRSRQNLARNPRRVYDADGREIPPIDLATMREHGTTGVVEARLISSGWLLRAAGPSLGLVLERELKLDAIELHLPARDGHVLLHDLCHAKIPQALGSSLDRGTCGSFPRLAARADNLDDVVDAFCHGSSSQLESPSPSSLYLRSDEMSAL